MVRRRMTLKRIDPWSVLKVGFVANLAILAIGLLAAAVVWFFIRRLQLIETVCGIATGDLGFETCAVDGGNLFRTVLLLGLLWVVVQTGLLVFWAFLANLISDLTGGLKFTFQDDSPATTARAASTGRREKPAAAATEERKKPPVDAAKLEETAARPAATSGAGATTADGDRMFGDRPGKPQG